MSKKNLSYIIITSVVTIILLYITDQVLTLSYLSKIGVKTVLFAIFPLIYTLKTGENVFKSSILNLKENRHKSKKMNLGLILGLAVFVIIIIAYIFMKQFIDSEQMILEFKEKYKIDKSNIIYYSLYLVFVNSFLEEFFFRGFIFLNIKKLGLKRLAYLLSSLLFAIYHIANFQNWLFIAAFVLALVGLFLGGYIFNYLDDKQNTFLNSWFVHICADLAIALIGLNIFGIINF